MLGNCLLLASIEERKIVRDHLESSLNWGASPHHCVARALRSGLLDSEAIVEFVRALCTVAQEELRPVASPRVYSLTKIIEISHFNMSRIRRGFPGRSARYSMSLA